MPELDSDRLYKCDIFVIRTSALDFKQLYMFYKFCPIKPMYLPDKTQYLARTFNGLSQTLPSLVCCILLEAIAQKFFQLLEGLFNIIS